jgi:hypothetical protein
VKPASGRVCFVDRDERIRVSLPEYQQDRTRFHDGRAVVTKGRFDGFVDEIGQEIIPPVYLSASPFSEGVAPVRLRQGLKCTFIDRDGRRVGEAVFHDLGNLSDGFAVAEKAGKAFYVDREMKTVLGPFEKAEGFWEGVACVTQAGRQRYINKTGEVLFHNEWDWISGICIEGRIVFTEHGRDGFLDKSGGVAIPAFYSDAELFSEGIALVKAKGKKLAIDLEGNVLFRVPPHEWVGHFREGLLKFKLHGKFGFLDRAGNVVIENRFTEAEDFSEGLAAVGEG